MRAIGDKTENVVDLIFPDLAEQLDRPSVFADRIDLDASQSRQLFDQ